jgi:hypothetical protein
MTPLEVKRKLSRPSSTGPSDGAGRKLVDPGVAGVPLAIRSVLAAECGRSSVPTCLADKAPEAARQSQSASLSAIAASPPCNPAFLQVARDRQGRSNAFLASHSKRCKQAWLLYPSCGAAQRAQRLTVGDRCEPLLLGHVVGTACDDEPDLDLAATGSTSWVGRGRSWVSYRFVGKLAHGRGSCDSLADAARDAQVLLANPWRTIIEERPVAGEVNDELSVGV